ncbi:pilus assembly protein PilM [Edwardsiella piscicida]
MGGGHWRMGIDIQPAQLIAVALSARRDGIQLRGWWRLPLTAAPDRDGLSSSLPAALAALRARLPRRLSVRTAFPAERAIRDTLPGSALPLSPWQRHRLLLAQGERQLMLPAHQLACDFAPAPEGGGRWQVCAVHRAQRDRWRALFDGAGLPLQRLTLAPCALRRLARLAGESSAAPLIYGDGRRFCWIAPWGSPLQYGFVSLADGPETACAQAVAALPPGVTEGVAPLRCGSDSGSRGWSGLRAVRHLVSPLPADPAAFCLALGLALMPESPPWMT